MLMNLFLLAKLRNVFLFNIIIAIIFSFIYYFIGMNENHFNVSEDNQNYLGCVYFAFVTQSTSGYGDITPKSKLAKYFNLAQVISIIFSLII